MDLRWYPITDGNARGSFPNSGSEVGRLCVVVAVERNRIPVERVKGCRENPADRYWNRSTRITTWFFFYMMVGRR